MMGLTIVVEHLIHKPTSPPVFPGSRLEARWYEQRWRLVGQLCELFGWRRLPWDEPGEREKADWSSFGRGRYYQLLWGAALVAEHGPGASRQMIPEPFVHPPMTPHFPHLTSRQDDGYLALYLPIPLATPAVLDAGTDFNGWGRITVGSSVQLGAEIDRLAPMLNDSWHSVADIAATISAYCAESQNLNVPMWIEW
jgi:hypothetical protein